MPNSDGGAGILGGAQGYSTGDKIGLVGSLLQDAYAGYWGKPGGNVDRAITQADNRSITSRLIGDLQSSDPAVRQKAYMFAQLNGVDTKPFQQQQATQQLPQLLQSMKPSQQTFPSQIGQLNNGSRITTAPIGFEAPGLNISDAIAKAPPELQGIYAPKLLDQQITAAQNAVSPASAEQKIAAGLDPRTPAQIDANGKISPITDPNQITAFQTANLARERKNSAETHRHNLATEANSAEGDIDPQTVNYWAQSVAAGQPLPALGMGKQAAQYRQAILKGAAQINSGQGLTGVDQNVNIATTKANSGALGKQTALRSATEGFENTMLQNMNVARDLLKKGAGTTGIPVLNRYQQYIKGQYAGDPDVVALKNAIDTVADENAKIRSGTLGNTPATDAMRASIHDGLNTSQTPEQILSAFGVMEKDAGNRSRALRAQEAALKRGLTGKNDLPQIPGISEPQSRAPGMTMAAPASLPRLPTGPKIRTFNPATGRLE